MSDRKIDQFIKFIKKIDRVIIKANYFSCDFSEFNLYDIFESHFCNSFRDIKMRLLDAKYKYLSLSRYQSRNLYAVEFTYKGELLFLDDIKTFERDGQMYATIPEYALRFFEQGTPFKMLTEEGFIPHYETEKQTEERIKKNELLIKRKAWKGHKQKMKKLKEELMPVAWHPERMEKWCLDNEEKEEIYNNFQ